MVSEKRNYGNGHAQMGYWERVRVEGYFQDSGQLEKLADELLYGRDQDNEYPFQSPGRSKWIRHKEIPWDPFGIESLYELREYGKYRHTSYPNY